MDTRKEGYMSEHLNKTKESANPMPITGKPDTDMEQVRLGLAMVMDGLRVMAKAGARVSKPCAIRNGAILMPVVFVHDHVITVMDSGRMFAIDGVSVMDKPKAEVKDV
jgi:hypothetical protein